MSKDRRRPNKVQHSDTSKGYRHIDKDPMMLDVLQAIRESGLSFEQIEKATGVTAATLKRWDTGTTRKPQRLTMEFALKAIGKRMGIIDNE
jgi:hypothetical protein